MELARGDGRGQRGERAEVAPLWLDPHAGMISRKALPVKPVG